MKYTVSYCLEHGKHKKVCEDSALIGTVPVNDEAGTAVLSSPCCVCLCDGVGGCAGGQDASLFVVNELSGADCPESPEDVKRLFFDINDRLLQRAQNSEDHKHMATTATALFLCGNDANLVNLGNTRLYAFVGGSLRQISRDQTLYQWFTDHHLRFLATERNRDVIYGAMGGKAKLLKPLSVERLPEELSGATMLLTSDGVHEHLSQAEIEDILKDDSDPAEKAKALCSSALEHGSEDDRSVIIISPASEFEPVLHKYIT